MIGVPVANSYYGNGTGPIWIDGNGTETNLGQCQRKPWGQNDCDHTEDASVICIGIYQCFFTFKLCNKKKQQTIKNFCLQ